MIILFNKSDWHLPFLMNFETKTLPIFMLYVSA